MSIGAEARPEAGLPAGGAGVVSSLPTPSGESAGVPGAGSDPPSTGAGVTALSEFAWTPVGMLSVKLNFFSASSFLRELNEAKKPPAVRNASLASCTALRPMPVLPEYQTTIVPVPTPLLESLSL